MKVLITGAAGFIGHALIKQLSATAEHVVGIDNINDYYDVELKHARLRDLEGIGNFTFIRADLVDAEVLNQIFATHRFDCVINLAAQAGVRYSLDNPMAYVQSNVVGFLNILEACRNFAVPKLLYASSSSVYGLSKDVPFSTTQSVDCPISLYAATKKANELMAHTYSHLYGQLSRDFTYIDDIISGVMRLLEKDGLEANSVFNIGHGSPVSLMDFIRAVESATGMTANCNYLPMQPGDVEQTWADTQGLFDAVGYTPSVKVAEGAARFVEWYRAYYKI